jgi:hypothetical protein
LATNNFDNKQYASHRTAPQVIQLLLCIPALAIKKDIKQHIAGPHSWIIMVISAALTLHSSKTRILKNINFLMILNLMFLKNINLTTAR